MKYLVYNSYDKLLGCYGQPQYTIQNEEDYIEGLRRGVLLGKLDKSLVAETVVCYLGEYDDKTGLHVLLPEPKIICDLGTLIPQEKKVEVTE